jgi:hypothetical protein
MIDLEEVFEGYEGTMFRCWRYEDAPMLLQNLSTHGGDEELVFVIPADIEEGLNESSPLYDVMYSGYIKPTRKKIGQYVVYITAH